MSTSPHVFSACEDEVIREIARHRARPTAVERLLEGIGRPFGRLFEAGRESDNGMIRSLSGQVQSVIEEGLIRTIKIGRRLTADADIVAEFERSGLPIDDIADARKLPLEELDRIADRFHVGSSILLATEGAALGALTTLAYAVPGAGLLIPSLVLTDVTSSMALLSRHACRVAGVYGFSSGSPETLPHVLAAMAPQTGTSDEGYVALKAAVVTSVREASQFMSRTATRVIDRQLLEREAPQLVRLIALVAERVGVVVTQKNLSILVPVAGAALNSSVNVAFQQVGHHGAKDYFRRMILHERFGEGLVEEAISLETDRLRSAL